MIARHDATSVCAESISSNTSDRMLVLQQRQAFLKTSNHMLVLQQQLKQWLHQAHPQWYCHHLFLFASTQDFQVSTELHFFRRVGP